jgi:hypothetical protein
MRMQWMLRCLSWVLLTPLWYHCEREGHVD